MFHFKSLVYKQMVYFLLVASTIMLILSVYFFYYSKEALVSRTFDQLTSIREIKKNQIEFVLNEHINTAKYISKTSVIRNLYNSYTLKTNIDISESELEIHKLGFQNIYIYEQTDSLNSNLISLFDDTSEGKNLNVIFKSLKNTLCKNNFSLSDYFKRNEQDTVPVMFLALPYYKMLDSCCENTIIIFEISSEIITNTLMKYSAEKGFGVSGEAYIVGEDYLLRSHSRFLRNSVMNTQVATEAATLALSGTEGKLITTDYRGTKVYSSFAPLHIYGLKWAILSEIDYKEALKSIVSMRNDIILLTIIMFVFIISISVILSLTIVNPIRKLEKAALSIGKGEFEVQLKSDSTDEIGTLTNTFNSMVNHISSMTNELREREQHLNYFYKATLEGIVLHEEGIPLLVNQALCRITGYTEGQLKQMTISELIKEYNISERLFETHIQSKSGNLIDVEIQNSTISYNNKTIQATIILDISERKTAEKELSAERMARLSSLYNGQEMERQRISRELHDGLGQQLAGIKLKLENLYQTEHLENEKLIENIKTNLVSSIDELRRISYNLRPPFLSELGLSASLENLCREFQYDTGILCELYTHGTFNNISLQTSSYIYRICQEGLNNISRHSGAGFAHLQLIENKAAYVVVIEDNGKGFKYSRNTLTRGNGLNNIHERVKLLEGLITVETEPGKGTTIRIKIPKKHNFSTYE